MVSQLGPSGRQRDSSSPVEDRGVAWRVIDAYGLAGETGTPLPAGRRYHSQQKARDRSRKGKSRIPSITTKSTAGGYHTPLRPLVSTGWPSMITKASPRLRPQRFTSRENQISSEA